MSPLQKQKKGRDRMSVNNEPKPFHLRGPLWVIWILVTGLFALLIWAAIYRIDSVARASGTVIASSRVQVIQSVDGGVLEQLLVREGDTVTAGQELAVLSQDRASASVNEISARLAALRGQEARLRAEVVQAKTISFPPDLKAYPETRSLQQALFAQRWHSLQEEMRTLKVAVDLAQEEVRLVHGLSATGDISRSEVIRVERALNEANGSLINRRNKFFQDARTELAKVQDDIAQNSQILAQRAEQLRATVFNAATEGVVKNVRITTRGGVLRPGDELMQIVPHNDTLIIEAKVLPSDIARIKTGLEANIRFDAFDYTVYGAVTGKVIYVSADTLKEESRAGEQYFYRVHVATPDQGGVVTQTGKKLDIIPGMGTQVDIRTGNRTVLDFLIKPIRKTMTEAFGEH